MKTYRTEVGPFKERPYYADGEIENICTDELIALSLYPPFPAPVRIDRFIEMRFGVTPRYENLIDGVLGMTVFGANGVQAMIVARHLDKEGTCVADRRIRTTLAHEAGHGLLHAHLFLSAERPLFGDYSDPTAPKVLCRDIQGGPNKSRPGYKGQWWEYQANRAIGAFLLPKPLAIVALDSNHLIETTGSLGVKTLIRHRREEAVQTLADSFDVNSVVAKIRLGQLYPTAAEEQFHL